MRWIQFSYVEWRKFITRKNDVHCWPWQMCESLSGNNLGHTSRRPVFPKVVIEMTIYLLPKDNYSDNHFLFSSWIPYWPKILDRNSWTNSAGPDQPVPLRADWAGSSLFATPLEIIWHVVSVKVHINISDNYRKPVTKKLRNGHRSRRSKFYLFSVSLPVGCLDIFGIIICINTI